MPELTPAEEREAQRYLPPGHNLDVDRRFTTQQVTTDLNRWRNDTSRMDLAGYDTRQEKEATPSEIRRATRGRWTDNFPADEPERFLQQGAVTQRLIQNVKDRFFDIDSFRLAVAEAYKGDNSLRNLVPNMTTDDYLALFKQDMVQNWVKENVEGRGIQILTQRFRVAPQRAREIWNHLPPDRQLRVLGMGVARLPRPRLPQEIRPVLPEVVTIRQRSRAGTYYTRQKPIPYTNHQMQFLMNRRGLPSKRVVEEFKSFFNRYPRTDSSVRNKFYRLPRLVRAPT